MIFSHIKTKFSEEENAKCCFKCYMYDECENRNECCSECDYYSNGECFYSEVAPYEELIEE